MTNTRQILVAMISMAAFLQAIKAYCDKHLHKNSASQRNDFTDLGEEALNKHIWKCYLPASKMGKSNRDINSQEASNLLQNMKHIDDVHLIAHYKRLPHDYLENTFITIVFSNYNNDDITEKLQNALFIKSILKSTANNGSIDTLKLKIELDNTLKKKKKKKKEEEEEEKVTDYINRSGKHPLVSFLEINPRTLKSFGGLK